MGEEEKKTVEELRKQLRLARNIDDVATTIRNDDTETILNLIEKLQKENETKEKIIDDMADWLYKDDTSFGYGKLKEVNTKERIVKFFENKTEQKQ